MARFRHGRIRATLARDGRAPLAVAVALVGCAALSGCGTTAQHVVVRVGGAEITASELESWISVMSPGNAAHLSAHQREELEHGALRYLIDAQWLIGEAAAEGAPVSSRQIGTRIREKYGSPEGQAVYKDMTTVARYTPADIRTEVQAELAAQAVRRSQLAYARAISPSHIKSYYVHDIGQFRLPERRTVQMVGNFSQIASARYVINQVKHGVSFASQSFLRVLDRQDFNLIAPEKALFDRVVFRSRPHVLVGPLFDNGYYFLFEVTNIAPARTEALSEATATIERELDATRSAKFTAALTSRWTARTTCAPGHVVQKCAQYHGPSSAEDPLEAQPTGG